MKNETRGEARVHVSAPPEKVYDMVSDVTRMGEWSPETVKCEWLGGASGPAVGARFKGTNRRGVMRWSTKPEVVAADPGREFAFVTKGVGPATRWSYRFEQAADGGTEVSESFEAVDDLPAYIRFCDRYLMGIKDRKADLEQGMQQTLERIKKVAEGSA
jgi:uncharacterized protein YndB with AHSA1/START domain